MQKGGYVDFPSWIPNQVPQSAYYPYNTLAGTAEDPTSANMQPSSRLFPDFMQNGKLSSGGKKRTNKRKSKKSRAIRNTSFRKDTRGKFIMRFEK
jgi:hypothetical protein